MAAINRRSIQGLRSIVATLATADDLNGTSDGTQWYDVSGADRVLIIQENDGTAGTAGIDVIEVSYDGGTNWSGVATLLAIASNDATGTLVDNGVLNAAGVEPTRVALWTVGPFEGPAAIRCTRDATVNSNSAAWSTGAPSVKMVVFGGYHAGGAPSTTLQ